MSNDKERKQLEKEMSDYLNKETKEMVAHMQKHQVDSLGIGKYVRNSLSFSEWKKLDWRSVYPDVDIKIISKVKIKDYGKFK